jgi:hypothetical protein
MKGYKFTDGEEVAHIDNLSQKLFVKRKIWRTVDQSTGEVDTVNGGFKKKAVKKLEGIEVYWWTKSEGGKKEIREYTFHSEQLVPWNVALKGKDESEKWLEEMRMPNYAPVKK